MCGCELDPLVESEGQQYRYLDKRLNSEEKGPNLTFVYKNE